MAVPVVGQAAAGRIPPSGPRLWSLWAVVSDICGKPLGGGVHLVAFVHAVLQGFGVGVRPREIPAFAGDDDTRGCLLPPWGR
jgi:hypothetical protein